MIEVNNVRFNMTYILSFCKTVFMDCYFWYKHFNSRQTTRLNKTEVCIATGDYSLIIRKYQELEHNTMVLISIFESSENHNSNKFSME